MQREIRDSDANEPIAEGSYALKKILPSCSISPELIKRLELIGGDMEILRDGSARHLPKTEVTIEDRDGAESLSSIDIYRRNYFPDDTREISVRIGSTWKNRVTIRFSIEAFASRIEILCQSSNARSDAMRLYDSFTDIIKDYQNNNWIFSPSWPILDFLIGTASFASLGAAAVLWGSSPSAAARLVATTVLIQIYANTHRLKPYGEFKTRANEEKSKWFSWFVFFALESTLILFILTPLADLILKGDSRT